mmetsp:Transcript_24378/g.58058  ORF Transcript_24378/g.58058 Transcript_24378/m.58058 type:complete len:100 (+) Transcript_24378:125-424(+)
MQDKRTKAHHLACLMASIKLIQKYQSEEEDSDSDDHVESSFECSRSSASDCTSESAPSPKCFIEPCVEEEIARVTLSRSASSKRRMSQSRANAPLDIRG